MSRSDTAVSFGELTTELSARCLEAIDNDQLDSIPSEQLGRMFAALFRIYAAKVLSGDSFVPFGREDGVSATDVAIGCTAMMDAVGLQLFELGAWQTMTNVRPRTIHK
jgi:hypothetical protein